MLQGNMATMGSLLALLPMIDNESMMPMITVKLLPDSRDRSANFVVCTCALPVIVCEISSPYLYTDTPHRQLCLGTSSAREPGGVVCDCRIV